MALKHILIVDDEDGILQLFSTILKSRGYSVTTASTAREALMKSQTSYYHLALLDIHLPDMKGTDLLNRMRSANPDMKIIMMTGNPMLDSAIASLNNGADWYIRKPVDNSELLSCIERKLKEQDDALFLTDERVTSWLEQKLSRLDFENSGITGTK